MRLGENLFDFKVLLTDDINVCKEVVWVYIRFGRLCKDLSAPSDVCADSTSSQSIVV